jgi:cephalosporin hydroxylase
MFWRRMKVVFNKSGQTVSLPDEVATWAAEAGSVMMDAAELTHLAAAVAAGPWRNDAIVVEIGAYRGTTTVFMARVLQRLGHDAPILSIDAFERVAPDPVNPQGVYLAYLEAIRLHGVAERCLPLAAFSQDAARVVPDTIGLLVVDGGHHYPVVSADLRLYAPKVVPGGFIFIDDYVPAYPDVMRAVDEYFGRSREFAIVHQSYFVVAQRR